jgi:long-subunit acyl-CoA synthetase (AMP-forming)
MERILCVRLSRYGLTETSSGGLWLSRKDSVRKAGYAGLPPPNFQMRLVDENEDDIQPGQEKRGELWIRTYS